MTRGILNPVQLPDTLYPAEEIFISRLREGQRCEVGTGKLPDDPVHDWGSGGVPNVIRGEIIRFFAHGGDAAFPIRGVEIHLQGAWIDGTLDLGHLHMPYALRFHQCHVAIPIKMQHAKCFTLHLGGSRLTKEFRGDGLKCQAIFFTRGFSTEGEVRLLNACVDRDLRCFNAEFKNLDGRAIAADGVKIGGDLRIRKISTVGCVSLSGAQIGGHLQCESSRFKNPNKVAFKNQDRRAIIADGARIGGDLRMRDVSAVGCVSLSGAQIGGHLECVFSKFRNPGRIAFYADSIETGGCVFFRGSNFVGEVRLLAARVGRDLDCSGSEFQKWRGDALSLDRVEVGTDVFLRNDFYAKGTVRLLGARIGGRLDCAGGQFTIPKSKKNYALNAEGVKTGRHVFLNHHINHGGKEPFRACGRVRFANADIGGNFNCKGGQFHHPNPKHPAIVAAGIRTRGAVFLSEGFAIDGNVLLHVAHIGGNFVCKECKQIKVRKNVIDLASAKAAALEDDDKAKDLFEFNLDGFSYGVFFGKSPKDAEYRIKWLASRPSKLPFSPLPYEQAAKALFAMEQNGEARKILLAKERESTKQGQWQRRQRPFRWLWGVCAGYGYELWRTMAWSAILIIIGAGIFWYADRCHRIVPSQALVQANPDYGHFVNSHHVRPTEIVPKIFPGHTGFTPLAYSLDVFIPFFVLHQESAWSPDSGDTKGVWKPSIFLVFAILALVGFAFLAEWMRRQQWKVWLGVPLICAVVLGAIYFCFKGIWNWLFADWWWLTVWYWLEIGAGWVLTSLFLLSVTGLLRPRQSGEKS